MTSTVTSASKCCSTCHVEKPLSSFHREARRKDGHDPRCRSCRAVARRRGPGSTPGYAEAQEDRVASFAPDPGPAVALRVELVDARRSGQSFTDAWPAAVTVALDTSSQRERESWEKALASTRDAFASAYHREVALPGHAAVGTLAEAA